MMHTITVLDGVARIEGAFTDEGVDLAGVTHVKGGEAQALAYLPVFEADLRRNFSELFPPP
uniref:hypothetical protein n=1 Tax=uncultured Halomonas sp. TaxID=173971 RepID=UPI00261AD744